MLSQPTCSQTFKSALFFPVDSASAQKDGYYGRFIGKLTEFHHGVSGEVYAVDARTLHLRNFNYDGEGPGEYFVSHFHFARLRR